jgi:hypothetical protein
VGFTHSSSVRAPTARSSACTGDHLGAADGHQRRAVDPFGDHVTFDPLDRLGGGNVLGEGIDPQLLEHGQHVVDGRHGGTIGDRLVEEHHGADRPGQLLDPLDQRRGMNLHRRTRVPASENPEGNHLTVTLDEAELARTERAKKMGTHHDECLGWPGGDAS